MSIQSCNFEIHGKVQRVYFRKYTQKRAKELGITGWVMNTPNNSVKGVIEGPEKSISKMKLWLKTIGSPQSKIVLAEFSNEQRINKNNYYNFVINK